jgi:hypothetical protein
MKATALLAAVASARLAAAAAIPASNIPASGVPITELDSYPGLLTVTEPPSDISLAAAAYAGTADQLTDGTPCRAVTLICTYKPVTLRLGLIPQLDLDYVFMARPTSNMVQTLGERRRAETSALLVTSAR